MDEPDLLTPRPEAGVESLAEIRRVQQSQQMLIQALLGVLLVLSGSLFLNLFYQVRVLRREARAIEPYAAQARARYQQEVGPRFESFHEQLRQFARQKPEFAASMAKYLATPGSAAPSPAPVTNRPVR